MIELSDCMLIESDIQAGGGATIDLHLEYKNGYIIEDKTLADGTHLYSEVPIGEALDDLTDDQVVAVAEAILKMCTRQSEKRPMTEGNKLAFDKLIADFHYDLHEIQEISDAIADYYD
jgi:hypothetical protein